MQLHMTCGNARRVKTSSDRARRVNLKFSAKATRRKSEEAASTWMLTNAVVSKSILEAIRINPGVVLVLYPCLVEQSAHQDP